MPNRLLVKVELFEDWAKRILFVVMTVALNCLRTLLLTLDRIVAAYHLISS